MNKKLILILILSMVLIIGCRPQETTGDIVSGKTLSVSLTEFSFTPSKITANKGETITLNIKNEGIVFHTFTSPELDIDVQLNAGEEKQISFVAKESGTFETLCTVFGHKALGMEGEISVI